MIRFSVLTAALVLSCCALSAQTPATGSAAPQSATPAANPVAPAVATTESATVDQFQKIEDAWSDAENRKDQYALELVLSPLLVDVSASGDITTRNQQLAQVMNNDDKAFYLDQKVITVRLLGDIAVANGTYTFRHKVSGSEMQEKGVFTHVFERVRNGWLCTNSQRTMLRTEPVTKGNKKSSTAEEPFHIPFFSKGDKSTTTTSGPQQ